MFFLAVPAFAGDPDKTVSVGESVSLSAKATDSDCDYTRNPRGEEKLIQKLPSHGRPYGKTQRKWQGRSRMVTMKAHL